MKLTYKDLFIATYFLAGCIANINWFFIWLVLLVAYAGVRLANKTGDEV